MKRDKTRLRRKKETLEMDDTLEVPLTRGSEGSDARGSRDPVAHPVETSIAQRTAPDLVLWSDEPGGFLEPAREERKARGHIVPIGPNMLDVALGMMAAICVEEQGPGTYVVSAVVEHLRAWGRKKVIFHIGGEPAIRALGVAIQRARGEETVIEFRPKYYSSPSMGPVANMNKELCGLVRCFRNYWREKAKLETTTESPLLPWSVRHCGWILSRYAVRADGRTEYSRLTGRDYTSGIAIIGEAIWYKLPKTADLTKLDDRWRAAIWLEKLDGSDEHIIGLENGAVLARSARCFYLFKSVLSCFILFSCSIVFLLVFTCFFHVFLVFLVFFVFFVFLFTFFYFFTKKPSSFTFTFTFSLLVWRGGVAWSYPSFRWCCLDIGPLGGVAVLHFLVCRAALPPPSFAW